MWSPNEIVWNPKRENVESLREKVTFSLEAFCDRVTPKYAKNVFAPGLCLTPLGELTTLCSPPPSQLGRGTPLVTPHLTWHLLSPLL